MRSTQTILAATVASIALVAGAASAQPGGNGHGNSEHKGNSEAHGNAKPGNSQKQQQAQHQQAKQQQAKQQQAKQQQAKQQQAKQQQAKQQQAKQQQAKRQQAQHQQAQHQQAQRQQAQQQQHAKQQQAKQQQAKQQQAKRQQAQQQQHAKQQQAQHQQAQRQQAQRQQQRQAQAAQKRRAQRYVAHREPRQDIRRVSYSGPSGHKVFVPTNDRVRVVTTRRDNDWRRVTRRVSYDGCPPGLAKKYNGCTPPGLARAPTRNWSRPDWYWNDYNRDYNYRYVDGYMVRTSSSNSILSYVPLLAGALAIGNTWPGNYQSVALPSYYDSYYGLGGSDSYRYYGDTIYRVEPGSSRIDSVAAVLVGNDIVVGQPMPSGYDIYNVPYGYRDQYYDSDDAYYRYSDGYIYQLDPTTRLVQAAIELLV